MQTFKVRLVAIIFIVLVISFAGLHPLHGFQDSRQADAPEDRIGPGRERRES